jgi:hypothetical protein
MKHAYRKGFWKATILEVDLYKTERKCLNAVEMDSTEILK